MPNRGIISMTATCIFRIALEHEPSIYRDIEIESAKSLYKLAEAIVGAFDFDFDHAFGFYSGAPYAKAKSAPQYELFADMGDADPGTLSVKKTRIDAAFPKVDHTMTFLFDYGDEWLFRVQLTGADRKASKVRYPRVIASHGEAPPQYPDPDDDDANGDSPTVGWSPVTGAKIVIPRK
jgi:hypothetical protein